jgi:hypothetical protein
MPDGWERIHPDFYRAITGYLKAGNNEHDDAPDALTGTVERRSKQARVDVQGIFGY